MTPADYWRSNSQLRHITPPGERFPEAGLLPILSRVCKGLTCEFGCGDGRLSPAFRPDQYLGYDINAVALEKARKNNPEHRFSGTFERGDTFLAHTVLLHIPDDEIAKVAAIAKCFPRVVIGEITGRRWRRAGNPPVYNREIEEYAELIGCAPEIIPIPYPRYGCSLSLMMFSL